MIDLPFFLIGKKKIRSPGWSWLGSICEELRAGTVHALLGDSTQFVRDIEILLDLFPNCSLVKPNDVSGEPYCRSVASTPGGREKNIQLIRRVICYCSQVGRDDANEYVARIISFVHH